MTAEPTELTLPEAEQMMRDAIDAGDLMRIEAARCKVALAVPEKPEPVILTSAL